MWYNVQMVQQTTCTTTILWCISIKKIVLPGHCVAISLWLHTFVAAHATEWRGHEMSTLWHHRPEEGWLWLALLFDVQDGNLLGDQAGALGPKCNTSPFYHLECLVRGSIPTNWTLACFAPRRAGATRPEAANAVSTTSLAIPTARTATDAKQLVNDSCWVMAVKN